MRGGGEEIVCVVGEQCIPLHHAVHRLLRSSRLGGMRSMVHRLWEMVPFVRHEVVQQPPFRLLQCAAFIHGVKDQRLLLRGDPWRLGGRMLP